MALFISCGHSGEAVMETGGSRGRGDTPVVCGRQLCREARQRRDQERDSSRRKRALEDLCESRLRYGVFLRGHVGFCVEQEEQEEEEDEGKRKGDICGSAVREGGVKAVALRFIPAGTRLVYMPVSSALTAESLGAEFQPQQQQEEGDDEVRKVGLWENELKRSLRAFEQGYRCACPCQRHSDCRKPCDDKCARQECGQDFCFKRVMTEEKVVAIRAYMYLA